MKRERATTLVQDMLTRLDAGGWPLDLIDEVHLFGSYARGALQPADVDVVVESRRDDRLVQEFVHALSYGKDPHASLKRALKGTNRGLQIQFDQHQALTGEGIELTLLWQRGDTLQQATSRLHAMVADADAGRAPRHDMIEQFEGLDRWIPRQARGDLIALLNTGAIDLQHLELTDSQPRHPSALEALERWTNTSPLRRSAAAALAHIETTGHDVEDVDLHGERVGIGTAIAGSQWAVGLGWRHLSHIPYHLRHGQHWLEVIRPTRAQSLHALHIRVRDRDKLPRS